MQRIFVISGEKSGDIIASELISYIQKQFPQVEIQGIGGDSFLQNGLKSLFDQNELSIMGFLEILPKIFKILRLIKITKNSIKKFQPNHIITIDSPGFNFIIAKKVKKMQKQQKIDCKIHHIVAPSVWAYKKSRTKTVTKLYNTLFCILPFEHQHFPNLKTIFIGYPPFKRTMEIQKRFNIFQNQTTIPITLGSRFSEINKHVLIIKQTILILTQQFPNLTFSILTLPNFEENLAKHFQNIPNVEIISNEDQKWKIILQSPFCIAKSGTNVMEFALLGIPSIVFYKTNFLTYCIIKFLAYTKFATILNFTANKAILPEFLQNNATSVKISLQAKIWLQNSEILSKTKQLMEKELEKFKTNINMPQVICNELNL